MVDWRDLKNVVSKKWEMDATINALVGTIIILNNVIEKLNSTILPKKYLDFSDVFDKVRADKLLHHSKHNLAIETEKDKQLLYGPIYDHSQLELDVLCKYVNEMLEKKFIIPSKLLAGVLVLFTKKKDSGLRLCVNYRSLNAIKKKNKYLLLLVQTFLNLFGRKKRYMKLDIISSYHALRICAGNKWKTTFKYRYGHFKYCVMPFRLLNTLAAFQAYINLALCEYICHKPKLSLICYFIYQILANRSD